LEPVPGMIRKARKLKKAEEIRLAKRDLDYKLSRLRERISDKEDELDDYRE